MTAIRWFTDEDVHGGVAVALRRANRDVLSVVDAGRLGEADEEQLRFATQDDRVIVSFNVRDFAKIHTQWLARGDHHAGIIVSAQRPIGDVVKRLNNLADTLSAEDIRDRIEFLSNW